ncbi:NmrA family NAD(P)-binding protein [Streptomyces polyrhachis]|uniref:NmrA family NAD(P)-binding protein n=1 Tax=Streptomyces polyrhachis TaxID=1282885 RepID=A0ABW2GK77_9ACTN
MTRVLVTGATGKQGGAVVDLLLERGHDPVAYVRDTHSDRAQALAAKGVALAQGDLADTAALTRAAHGAGALFGVTIPFGANGATEETAQGRALADAAARAGAHLVYSSVKGAAARPDFKVEFASAKQTVQRHLESTGAHFTTVQPAYFMENALNTGFNRLHEGVYAFPLSPHRKLDQTTVLDIAGFAVHAIENPEKLAGRAIDVVSDTVTTLEAAQILAEVTGRQLPYENIPLSQIRQWAGDEIAGMFQSFEDNRQHTDLTALRAEFPEVRWHSYRDWAESIDWERVLSAPPGWS